MHDHLHVQDCNTRHSLLSDRSVRLSFSPNSHLFSFCCFLWDIARSPLKGGMFADWRQRKKFDLTILFKWLLNISFIVSASSLSYLPTVHSSHELYWFTRLKLILLNFLDRLYIYFLCPFYFFLSVHFKPSKS